MFSHDEKIRIAKEIHKTLTAINHPEMDMKNIRFNLHVFGKADWSWADIHETREENLEATKDKNPHNERAREYAKEDTKKTK